MVEHLGIFVRKSDTKETEIGIEFEKALLRAFEKHCFQIHDRKVKAGLSMRGDKTYIFPFSQKDDYASLVRDKERFCREVIEKLVHLLRSSCPP